MLSAAMLTTSSSTMAGPTKSEPLEQEESVGRRKSARASSTGPAASTIAPSGDRATSAEPASPFDRAEAVALGIHEGQPAGIRGVAAEDPERVLARAGGIDVEAQSAVVAHREGGDAGETVHSSDAVAHDLPEGQRADCGVEGSERQVAGEDRDRIVARTRDVDVQVVRRDHDAARDGETVHAADAVGLALLEVERAGSRIAVEDHDGVVVLARGVDPLTVEADRDRAGAGEPIDAADAVHLRLDEGQGAGRRIAVEDGDRVAVGSGDVERVARPHPSPRRPARRGRPPTGTAGSRGR